MIENAFKLLQIQLGEYIGDKAEVIVENIAQVDTHSVADKEKDLKDKLILTLVNIEEEVTLKNGNHFNRYNLDVRYKNPPVFLNLYLLVSAKYDDYGTSLKRLSGVVQFFQGKNSFSIKNSPSSVLLVNNEATFEDYEDLVIYLDMFSLSFEQLNHLWGSLGGKQWPSVLYKVRLVRITDDKVTGLGTVIEKIRTIETVISQ